LILTAGFAAEVFAQGRTANLTVDVSGLRNYKGKVVLAMWADVDASDKFPDLSGIQIRDERDNALPCDFSRAKVCRRTVDSLQHLTVSYTFREVPVGKYAVFVFHDENNNGLLDTGLFNRPLEARGFSQVLPDDVNPIASRIPFSRASFVLAEDMSIVIGLRYPPRL
jgi:uncharacterized protein (DUF2141 family)